MIKPKLTLQTHKYEEQQSKTNTLVELYRERERLRVCNHLSGLLSDHKL